jgi:hypothetical protein
VGLDRLCHPRGGGPHRRDRLVVAETLRPRPDEGAGGWRRGGWIIVSAYLTRTTAPCGARSRFRPPPSDSSVRDLFAERRRLPVLSFD